MSSIAPLRLALRANAVFSAISALVLVFAHGELGATMGVPAPLLIAVGVGLAIFSILLLVTAARTDLAKMRAEALSHSCADFAWVAASIVVIVGGWLTPLGNQLLGAVGIPVLALGIAQFKTLPAKSLATQA